MNIPKRPIIIIPSRLASLRLPNKPLAKIKGEPMIVLCMKRAQEADIGPVVVACGDQEIYSVVHSAGGQAVMTNPSHRSGSDRIFEAFSLIDPDEKHDCIINFQGDMPTIDPGIIRAVLDPMVDGGVEISTLVTEIKTELEISDLNVVKAVVGIEKGQKIGRAIYFSRADVPSGSGPKYHHIGLYAYRPGSLKKFVGLPNGVLENRESLEQLRALEHGLRIDAALVDTLPLGVDTLADLESARRYFKQK